MSSAKYQPAMNKIRRLLFLSAALITIVGLTSCYISKPHGCGCGMEEHVNH